MSELMKTPLYETHVQAGGKMVPFAGYSMPVQYGTGVIREHMAVRTACGLFDVSHMGEVTLTGRDAVKNLNYLLTNDYSGMSDGRARYSPMCTEQGGVVDDLIVYKVKEDHYLIVVNAANRRKDFSWICDHLSGDVKAEDISDSVAQLALQGPNAKKILLKLAAEDDLPVKYYSANFHRSAAGTDCIISKTGYTGEDGYELYTASESAAELWGLLLDAGREDGLIPCGLGARDTLRLEAAMPLYGHEMDESVTPIEAGLGHFVRLDSGKGDFIGREAILAAGEPKRIRVGLKVTGRGIIREEEDVFDKEGNRIGRTTSGTYAPYLGYPVAMAMLDKAHAQVGMLVEADVRGRRVEAEIVPLPFYKKGQKR